MTDPKHIRWLAVVVSTLIVTHGALLGYESHLRHKAIAEGADPLKVACMEPNTKCIVVEHTSSK